MIRGDRLETKNDLIGKRFGRLVAVEDLGIFAKDGNKTKSHYVKCKCDCGNEIIVNQQSLKRGITVSCGCYNREVISKIKKKRNECYVYKNIAFVKFTNCDEYFICDLEDWDKLKDYAWFKNDSGYAVTSLGDGNRLRFHRLVTNCPEGLEPDHICPVSSGVCDNRKCNLAVVSHKENIRTQSLRSDNTSGYKGIYFNKNLGKWQSYIGVDGTIKYIGVYANIEDAIEARKQAETKYWSR